MESMRKRKVKDDAKVWLEDLKRLECHSLMRRKVVDQKDFKDNQFQVFTRHLIKHAEQAAGCMICLEEINMELSGYRQHFTSGDWDIGDFADHKVRDLSGTLQLDVQR